MKRFQLAQSAESIFTSHSGLALIGLAINKHTRLRKTLRSTPKRHGIANVDFVRTYVGQLCLGKSDFDVFESLSGNQEFCAKSPRKLLIHAILDISTIFKV